MSNRIEVGSRGRVCSREDDPEERACHEPPEAARARSEREAQMRAERWARGEDERGMSTKHGTSQLSPTPQTSEGLDAEEQRRVDADNRQRLARVDQPLEDDPIGNAIPGLLAGGIVGGLEGAAGGAGARGIAGSVAAHAVEHVEADALTHAHPAHGAHGAHSARDPHEARTAPKPTVVPKQATATAAPARKADVPAGQTGANGLSSEPVKEPNESVPPPVIGRDRSPYAPGTAPVCVPERPVVIQG